LLGRAVRARPQPGRGVLRHEAARAPRRKRQPAPRERRRARGIPQRRHRLQYRGGDHGAADPATGEDVLDRLHRAGVQRARLCAARRRAFRHRAPRAGGKRYLDAVTLFGRDDKRKLFRAEIFESISKDDAHGEWLACLATADGGWLAELQYLDLVSYLPLDILTKVDRMSMAHSLEAR